MATLESTSRLEESNSTSVNFRRKHARCSMNRGLKSLQSGLPAGCVPLESQVGGHIAGDKADTIGMLRSEDGWIYKPIEKPLLGEREIMFYEKLQESTDMLMLELRQYVPKYYGTEEIQLGGKNITFLKLQDVTEGMSEPCVMDIKIGKQTWDPLAGPVKRAGEEKKYAACKREYGFCIPGFQVSRLSTGVVEKYGKDYGKNLDKEMTFKAMEIFLNGQPDKPPDRNLILQFLSTLWKILGFFRLQTKLRFYSSSLLLAYDAKRLRQQSNLDAIGVLGSSGTLNSHNQSTMYGISRTPSWKLNFRPVCAINDERFSGQLTENGPIFEKTLNNHSPISTPSMSPIFMRRNRTKSIKRSQSLKRSNSTKKSESAPGPNITNHTADSSLVRNSSCGKNMNTAVEKLCRTHSYTNNFEQDILKMKEDYAILLDELTTSPDGKRNWVRVKMIDFAHVFPGENDGLDTNYLEGIKNLIKLLEHFLTPE